MNKIDEGFFVVVVVLVEFICDKNVIFYGFWYWINICEGINEVYYDWLK